MFKKTKLWLGWMMSKSKQGSLLSCGLFLGIVLSSMSLSYLVLYFIEVNATETKMTSLPHWVYNPLVIILAGITGFILISAFMIGASYNDSKVNFRVAIDKATKFKVEHPRFGSKIDGFIRIARHSEDPVSLNELIKMCKELISMEEKLVRLKDEQKKLPAQIEKEREKIKNLKLEMI